MQKRKKYFWTESMAIMIIPLLVSSGSDQTIEKVAQLIKRESSFWFNNKSGFKTKLQWQDEYFAVSVSQSALVEVRAYIDGQVIHHQKKSFADEYDEFIAKYGFQLSNN